MASPQQPYIVTLPPIAPGSPGSASTNQYSPGTAMPVHPPSPMYPRGQRQWSMYPGLQQRWPMYPPQQGAMMAPPPVMPGYYPPPYTASFPQMMPFGSGGPGSWRPSLGWPSTAVVQPWTVGGVAQPMMIASGGYPTTYYPNYPVSTPYYPYPNPGPATVIVDSEHLSRGHNGQSYGHYDGHHHEHEHHDDHENHHHHGHGPH